MNFRGEFVVKKKKWSRVLAVLLAMVTAISLLSGCGGKMTPSAVLVIKDGSVRMVPVNNNDPVSKIIDMAPDVIHRFMNKSEDDAAVEEAVEHISEEE